MRREEVWEISGRKLRKSGEMIEGELGEIR